MLSPSPSLSLSCHFSSFSSLYTSLSVFRMTTDGFMILRRQWYCETFCHELLQKQKEERDATTIEATANQWASRDANY